MKLTQVNVRLEDALVKAIKVDAIRRDETLEEWIRNAALDRVPRSLFYRQIQAKSQRTK
jgi:hypothetical protein